MTFRGRLALRLTQRDDPEGKDMSSMDVFLRRAKAALDQPKDDCLTVVFRGLTSDEKRKIITKLGSVRGTNGQGKPEMTVTLRDYFAGQIAAAMMTATSADRDFPNIDYQRDVGGPTIAERVATIAYRMADAMLKAREAGDD